MQRVRIIQESISRFGNDVICLKNVCSFFYLMFVNIAFCVTFYADANTQIKILYALLACILCFDILTSSTKDHSILYEIITWPIRDFFKVFFAVYYLKENVKKENAFVCATFGVTSLLISPAYKSHNINAKIRRFFSFIWQNLKSFLINYIIVPIIKLYNWIKYICLFRWMPDFLSCIHKYWLKFYNTVDRWILAPLRVVLGRMKEFIKYWLFFGFWADLRNWTKAKILTPIFQKLKRIFHAFVYVVGCYWLEPLMRSIGRVCLRATKRTVGILKDMLGAFGLYVLQPIALILWEQVKLLSNIFFQIAIVPVLGIFYKQYKFVEDLVYIYLLGPFFKKFIEIIPEKNPFSGKHFN